MFYIEVVDDKYVYLVPIFLVVRILSSNFYFFSI